MLKACMEVSQNQLEVFEAEVDFVRDRMSENGFSDIVESVLDDERAASAIEQKIKDNKRKHRAFLQQYEEDGQDKHRVDRCVWLFTGDTERQVLLVRTNTNKIVLVMWYVDSHTLKFNKQEDIRVVTKIEVRGASYRFHTKSLCRSDTFACLVLNAHDVKDTLGSSDDTESDYDPDDEEDDDGGEPLKACMVQYLRKCNHLLGFVQAMAIVAVAKYKGYPLQAFAKDGILGLSGDEQEYSVYAALVNRYVPNGSQMHVQMQDKIGEIVLRLPQRQHTSPELPDLCARAATLVVRQIHATYKRTVVQHLSMLSCNNVIPYKRIGMSAAAVLTGLDTYRAATTLTTLKRKHP